MEDTEEAEFHTQTFCGGGEQGLGGGVEEDSVDDFFVVEGKGGDLLGEGEDDVKVFGGQQFGSAIFEPVLARDALTLGAVAVAAGAVANVSELAVVAPFDGAAQQGRTAGFDGLHQAVLMQRQGMRLAVRGAVLSKDAERTQACRPTPELAQARFTACLCLGGRCGPGYRAG